MTSRKLKKEPRKFEGVRPEYRKGQRVLPRSPAPPTLEYCEGEVVCVYLDKRFPQLDPRRWDYLIKWRPARTPWDNMRPLPVALSCHKAHHIRLDTEPDTPHKEPPAPIPEQMTL